MKPHPLKVERELRGWSQARVAEAVGTNVRTVIRWEQGQSVPYPYHRELLCELFSKNARNLGLLEEIAEEESQEARPVPRSLEAPLFDSAIPVAVGSSGGPGQAASVGERQLCTDRPARIAWDWQNLAGDDAGRR